MSYVEGHSREQRVLFPEILDDYISADNVVRFIDVFVDGLKMEEMGFLSCEPKATGCRRMSAGFAQAVYLRVFKPGKKHPAIGAGVSPQCGGDVASAQASAGL